MNIQGGSNKSTIAGTQLFSIKHPLSFYILVLETLNLANLKMYMDSVSNQLKAEHIVIILHIFWDLFYIMFRMFSFKEN